MSNYPKDVMSWKLCQGVKQIWYYRKSIIWGLIFVATIPIFACVYYMLPEKSWSYVGEIRTYLDAMYYSAITITTLGFGDITPNNGLARSITMIEVITGVVVVGSFLNAVATEKANQISRQKALQTLQRLLPLSIPQIQLYLYSCFEMMTPIDERNTIVLNDIYDYEFDLKFNRMYDLNDASLFMTTPINQSVVERFFQNELRLYDELKYLASNVELSYWKELQEVIDDFLREVSNFPYRDVIITYSHNNDIVNLVKKIIRESGENIGEFECSNIVNPYKSLFCHIEVMISYTQKIVKNIKMTNGL